MFCNPNILSNLITNSFHIYSSHRVILISNTLIIICIITDILITMQKQNVLGYIQRNDQETVKFKLFLRKKNSIAIMKEIKLTRRKQILIGGFDDVLMFK